MKRCLRCLDEHFEEYCMGAFLVAMTLVMFLQIVLRLFDMALSWPEEFSRYSFVYMTFLSVGYCVRRGSMLRVDLMSQLLPQKVGKRVDLCITVGCGALYLYLLVAAVELVRQVSTTGRVSTAMQLPYTVIYASLIAGFAMAVLRSVQMTVRLVRAMTAHDKQGGNMV